MNETIQTKELLEWLADQKEQAMHTLDALFACISDMSEDQQKQSVLMAGALEHRLLSLQNAIFLVQEFVGGKS